jgi:threonyl-tRNA synthetase
VFKHSSAHILGAALEQLYGAHLCIGPPLENGFYYDSYMGDEKISPANFEEIVKQAKEIIGQNLPFQKLILTKDQALKLFSSNPFKQQLIKHKVPEGAKTSAYKCGTLIDLCMGPHVPATSRVKAFNVTKSSAAYWLAKKENDNVQRVYGVSFPTQKQLDEWNRIQEEIAKRDHRNVGAQQNLFEFDTLSPGSCFFFPHGAKIYNNLVNLMRKQYIARGFQEVVTPNMFSSDLWKLSGEEFL